MKMTIGMKLGVGFAIIILLLVLSAGVAYYNVRNMRTNLAGMLDQAVPTVRTCNRLSESLIGASAALRGYLVLEENPEVTRSFQEGNESAWNEVDTQLQHLVSLAAASKSAQLQEQVDSVARMVGQQRTYHQQIMQLALAADNEPARYLLEKEIVPQTNQMLTLLAEIMDEERQVEATADRRDLLKAAADYRATTYQSISDLRAFLTKGTTESRQAFADSRASNTKAFEELVQSEKLFSATQKQQWDRVVALDRQYEPLLDEVLRLRSGDDWNKAESIWAKQSTPLGREIRNALEQITVEAEATEAVEREQLEAAGQRTVVVLFGAAGIAVVICTVIAVLLSRSIATTVRALADRARQISEGDLTGASVVAKGADELGQLADGFNVMMANLRDLTGQILSVTENVNSATSQISASAQQQATSTKEQAATVQEITSTMQEITQSGAQIVAKAKEVATVAEQASTASKTGMDAVQNTTRTMEAIREQVEEVAENIVALSERTQAVGEIISTVNEVAEQSNLLALNATIEAAEAGDEGSRFSVVAAEMKNLADQAKECTANVRKILGEIQRGINTSVMLTEEAVKRVEAGKQQADVSENVIRQISSTTEESIQAFQQIIGATNQQQVGFEQVAKGMQDIDQATQQTATGTAQLESAVVNLSALSKQLQTAVASYRI